MKYNEKYDRYITKEGLVYKYDSKQDKLVLCKQYDIYGYKYCSGSKMFRVHRGVYETFVGEIPEGYVIDHINTIRDDNRMENLRLVTPAENSNNPLTIQHHKKAKLNKPHSDCDFGKKYFEHFGYSKTKDPKQYERERQWYRYHHKCRWE